MSDARSTRSRLKGSAAKNTDPSAVSARGPATVAIFPELLTPRECADYRRCSIESGQTVVAALTCGLTGASFTDAEMSINLSDRIFGWPDKEAAPLRSAPYDAPRPAERQRAEVRKENESSWGALSYPI
jgi:hypothetical protein